jgi:ribosome-binding factor A
MTVADEGRTRRMSVRVREVVASVVEGKVKDPRLGLVTITDARLTPDLREAKVFWTAYGDETAVSGSAAALESAKGVIRTAVGRATGLKHTPSIEFILDAVPETAQQIEDLLALARAEDERVQAIAEQARPAGEIDPYRHEDE